MALFAFLGLTRIVGKIVGFVMDYEAVSLAWAIREAAE